MFATRLLVPALLLWSAPAWAAQDTLPVQEPRPPTAAERAQTMIDDAKRMYGPRSRSALCAEEDPLNKGIVVCARDRSERYRVPPSSDDPHTPTGTRGGGLTPPDMYGGPPCTGVCIRGGYAPPPVYYFDITKLPEPPPGSDAEKIAKGEARAP